MLSIWHEILDTISYHISVYVVTHLGLYCIFIVSKIPMIRVTNTVNHYKYGPYHMVAFYA